jgi:riboflavin synthase
MFSGIVEELGRVRRASSRSGGTRLEIGARSVLDDAEVGASIAVNGCCLTVVALSSASWEADVVGETLRRTNLGALAPGDPVNLERPVRLADRLGGHLVQGHVDAVARLVRRDPHTDGSVVATFAAPADVLRYVVHKGSVAVDGISLTVAAVDDEAFSVAVIPHTLAITTLGTKQIGDTVNLEADVLAKYVERLLTSTETTR